MKRALLMIVSIVAILLLLCTIAWWVFLARWVPTQGKARIEAELERRFPIDVSIGALRYEPLRGFLLTDAQVADHAWQELMFAAPAMRLQIGWWPLLLQRVLVFRAEGPTASPVATDLMLSGRYDLTAKSLTLNVRTSAVPLTSLSPTFRRRLPHALSDGTFQAHLRVSYQAGVPALITGTVKGSRVVWTSPTFRARTDVTVDGRVTPPDQRGGRWSLDTLVTVREGTLEGMKGVGTITDCAGTARLTEGSLAIEELTGTIAGSRWTLTGTLHPLIAPTVEALFTSTVQLESIVKLLPSLATSWQPSGPADLQVVCRGPLQPHVMLDCLLNAQLRGATLAGEMLKHPLTQMSGRLAYDPWMRRLAIAQLSGQVLGDPVSLTGEVVFTKPTHLTLHVKGTLPLEALEGSLAPEGPVSHLGGKADVDLSIRRERTTRYTGRVELREAGATLTAFPHPLEQVFGSVVFSEGRIEAPQLSLRVKEQPITLTATLDLQEVPRLSALVQLPQGRLQWVSRATPEQFLIDEATLSLTESRLTVTGTMDRTPPGASNLNAKGTVDLAELNALPFIALPALKPWQLQGRVDVNASFTGKTSAWQAGEIRGRVLADALSVREIPIEQLACQVEQLDGTLRVRIPAALIANGKFQGEATMEHTPQGTDYLFQADLTGLHLERLALAIPAWRSRSVTGIASAHAAMTGTWEKHPTWRGEGWLNASGKQLGDLPLLDKVFRGLFGVLGDRLGLDSLRRAQITQASLTWRLADERIRTEDLRLGGLSGTEPVAIYARGSVGLDQTLDFVIEPELSEGTVLESPTTSTLASTILKAAGQLERLRRLIGRHRLVGTLKEPDYRFEVGPQETMKQIAPGPTELLQGIIDSLR